MVELYSLPEERLTIDQRRKVKPTQPSSGNDEWKDGLYS